MKAIAQRKVVRRSLAESLLSCTDFEGDQGEQLAFGQAFHSFAAAYTLQCQATGEETRLTDVGRLAGEAWARTHGLEQARFVEFTNLCESFAAAHPARLETLMHVEHTETLEVGDDLLLTATMDRIDRADMGDPDDVPRRELITDYKTEIGEMRHDFQIAFYVQLRLLANPALEEIGFQIDPVRGFWQAEVEWVRRGQLDGWWSVTIQGLRERLKAPPGNPTGGPACSICRKRYECPRATAIARAMPENDDQAAEILQDRLRLAAGVAVLDEALKHYFVDRPVLVAAGHEVGYLQTREPSFKVTAPATQLLTWARKKHMDIDALLKAAAVTNRGVQDTLVAAGLAKREFNEPEYKIRKHVPARDARKRKKQEEETNGSSEG